MSFTRILICLSIPGSKPRSQWRVLGVRGMETAALLAYVCVFPGTASLFYSRGHSQTLRPIMSFTRSCLLCLVALEGPECVNRRDLCVCRGEGHSHASNQDSY